MAGESGDGNPVHRARQPLGERILREFQWEAAGRMTLADARVALARLPAEMKLVAPYRSLWQEYILQFPSHCGPFAGG